MTKQMDKFQAIVISCIAIFFLIAAIVCGIMGESFWLFVAMIVAGLLLIGKIAPATNNANNKSCDSYVNIPNFSDDMSYSASTTLGETEFFCKIAGVAHRNNSSDIGGFIGFCQSDPNNPHDPNAIGVYNDKGRLLGYIPKEEQLAYRKWSKRDPIPCIGFITEDRYLHGKVKVIDANPDLTELHILKFAKWLVANHGVDYFPSGITLESEVQPKTADDWIEILIDSIADKQAEIKAKRHKSSPNQQEE